MNQEEMKNELVNGLLDIREEYLSILFKDFMIKDQYGKTWDIIGVEFRETRTIIRLGLPGKNNRSCIVISNDGSTNELKECEIIKKHGGAEE